MPVIGRVKRKPKTLVYVDADGLIHERSTVRKPAAKPAMRPTKRTKPKPAARFLISVRDGTKRDREIKFAGSFSQAKAKAKAISQTERARVEVASIDDRGVDLMIGQWRGHDEGNWSQE